MTGLPKHGGITLIAGSMFLLANLLLVTIVSVGTVSSAAKSTVEVVPCSDPRGCPDLIVDADMLKNQWHIKSQTFSETDCAVIEGATQPGKRLLLLFTSMTPNIGPGDLIVGAPSDRPEWFSFNTCHGHPHFNEYADYRLWTTQGYAKWIVLRAANPGVLARDLLKKNPDLTKELVIGRKQGFCIADVIPYFSPPPPIKYVWPDACRSNQGVSAGWADEYIFTLDAQWIDITGLAAGRYVLEVEVNAEHFFKEENYGNNFSAVDIEVPDKPGR